MPQYQIEKPFDRRERLMDLIVGGESVVIELYSNLCSGNTRQLPPEVCICICRVEKLGQATERHQSRQMGPSNLWPLLCSYTIVASRGEQALSWLDRSIRSQDRQSHATPRRMHRLSTGALGTPKLAACASLAGFPSELRASGHLHVHAVPLSTSAAQARRQLA